MTAAADIEAAIDVIDDIARDADHLDVDEAARALDELSRLMGAVREAMSLVESGALAKLEQPKVIGQNRYVKVNRYTRRFDHGRIAKMVAERAVAADHDTGEIRSAHDAARVAAIMMREIYVSNSTDAKVNALRALLGVGDAEAENLARDEHTGSKLQVYELRKGEE